MRAAVYRRYGPPEVVSIQEIPTPVPLDDEVLVRICAATVTAPDWRFRSAKPFFLRFMNGLLRPTKRTVLGTQFSGEVAAAGRAVTRFAAGDQVFGSTGWKFGAHAEYVCVPATGTLAAKPANVNLEDAAAILFGGVSALHFLSHAGVQRGQHVLVYGASGSVGVYAVQIAKHLGAEVTAVCGPANLSLVQSLGADETIDYTREDFSRRGRRFDVIFDAVGKSGFWRSLRSLRRGGAYVLVAGDVSWLTLGRLWCAATGAARMIGGVARGAAAHQAVLTELIEAGHIRPVIGRRYDFEDIAEAHRYAGGGHKRGEVVLRIGAPRSDAKPAAAHLAR